MREDCDNDSHLYRITKERGAFHTGYRSCFYRTIDGETTGKKVFDAADLSERRLIDPLSVCLPNHQVVTTRFPSNDWSRSRNAVAAGRHRPRL
ncbi:phosphoribosyl-AMP cyclohydrolase [Natrinema saccharevitans]|uniref:hypothetical protein n=1 Tax=Natrinema saccharevitans TaxID=301967 RepID=UPI00373FD9FA